MGRSQPLVGARGAGKVPIFGPAPKITRKIVHHAPSLGQGQRPTFGPVHGLELAPRVPRKGTAPENRWGAHLGEAPHTPPRNRSHEREKTRPWAPWQRPPTPPGPTKRIAHTQRTPWGRPSPARTRPGPILPGSKPGGPNSHRDAPGPQKVLPHTRGAANHPARPNKPTPGVILS